MTGGGGLVAAAPVTMSDQLQADSVLQSMTLLLTGLKLSWPKDKTLLGLWDAGERRSPTSIIFPVAFPPLQIP